MDNRSIIVIPATKTDTEVTELYSVLALLPYLALSGSHPGPLFIMQDLTYLTKAKFMHGPNVRKLVLMTQNMPVTALGVVQQLLS